jgi:hypothetical protein
MISTITFRNNVNNFWYNWCDWIEDYTSLTGTSSDTSELYWKITRSIQDFYDPVKSAYGKMAAENVCRYLLGMFEGLVQAKTLIENNVDPQVITDRVAPNVVGGLVTTLSSLNSDWTSEVLTPVFVNIWTAWLEHCTATLASDMTAADAAESKALINSLAFADAFVNGTIKQYNPIFF